MVRRCLVAAIYAHPEGYPPTLNAVSLLSQTFQDIELLYRPHLREVFSYPRNVHLHASGERMSEAEQMSLPVARRYLLFAGFCRDLRELLEAKRPEVVLVYDPLALLALTVVLPLVSGRPLLWYHNHDVLEPGRLRRLSLAWFSDYAQRLMFSRLDIFSLPARERERYFPMARLRGQYVFLPNLPSLRQIELASKADRDPTKLRLIFQGRVSQGHGLEELIAALPLRVAGRDVELVLAGWITPEFEAKLRDAVVLRGAASFVRFAGYLPYARLHELTASCDIGIAVYRDTSVMNSSVATASNKIYEYAAAGLPILYLDTPHFREHLGHFEWAIAWDGETSGVPLVLSRIAGNCEVLSLAARASCRESLNFDRHFDAVLNVLRDAV